MFSLKGVADPSCVPNHTKIRVELHLPDPLLPAFVCFRTSGEDYAACGISALFKSSSWNKVGAITTSVVVPLCPPEV